jgi:putative Mg2+ transporter-C (MgtC) family protein
MPLTTPDQLELLARIGLAALLGGLIGLERELRGHQAGVRTYGLLALGAALFTVLGAYGFGGPQVGVDPTRVAAQIVSGVGFLCAGAIFREGFTIRGLTTAASLWAATAVGVGAAAGEPVLAIGSALIVLFSLSPLGWLTRAIATRTTRSVRLYVRAENAKAAGAVTAYLAGAEIPMKGYQIDNGADELVLQTRLAIGSDHDLDQIAKAISEIRGVRGVDMEGAGNG